MYTVSPDVRRIRRLAEALAFNGGTDADSASPGLYSSSPNRRSYATHNDGSIRVSQVYIDLTRTQAKACGVALRGLTDRRQYIHAVRVRVSTSATAREIRADIITYRGLLCDVSSGSCLIDPLHPRS